LIAYLVHQRVVVNLIAENEHIRKWIESQCRVKVPIYGAHMQRKRTEMGLLNESFDDLFG
jgi:hypothetical protein